MASTGTRPPEDQSYYLGSNYSQLIADALTRYPERDALVMDGQRITYAALVDMVGRTQRVLAEHGVGPGGAVGVLSPNAPEVVVVQMATALIGARYTGLHPMGSLDDQVFVSGDAEIEILFVHPKYAAVGAEVAAKVESVRAVVTLGVSEAGPDLAELCERVGTSALWAEPVPLDTIGWLSYTGGTSGKPKGVMVPHRALVQQVQSVTASWGMPERPIFLASPPITHAAMLPLVPVFTRGGTIVLQQGFDPDAWLDAVETERVNLGLLVPTMIYTMLDRADAAARDTSSLETLLYGAAPITPSRLSEAQEAFGSILLQTYGQTECIGLISVLRKDEHDPVGRPDLLASCGRPMTGMRVEVLGDDDRQLADGEVGEIGFRGPSVMNGYWKREEETAEALRGGWLHTGDMAFRDPQGYLYLVDRKKDVIITGGFNVYPKEIEDVLTSDDSVSQAAVIGLPDDKWGESVTAFVVARPGAVVDASALQALVKQRKGSHQSPKRVEVLEELPTTLVGKIDKKVLRARYWPDSARRIH